MFARCDLVVASARPFIPIIRHIITEIMCILYISDVNFVKVRSRTYFIAYFVYHFKHTQVTTNC